MGSGLTPDQAKEFYDRVGSKQDSQAFYEDPAIQDLIEHAGFDSARAVFEFGCGTGRLAERLLTGYLPTHSRYLGVDISSTMIGIARERLSCSGDRAEVRLCDGSPRLDVATHMVDRFVCTYVLDLLRPEDIRSLLFEAHRILSANGRLCLVSLTHGPTLLSRLVSRAWAGVYSLRPQLTGGCRPINALDWTGPDNWAVQYRHVVISYGISSEVLIARPLRSSQGVASGSSRRDTASSSTSPGPR